MIKTEELIEKFRQALCDGWGYIYGAAGEVWTQAKQDKTTDDMAKQYGQKWVGRHVADCSGLFCWAFKQLGGEMFHGSNTMWRQWTTETHDSISDDIVPGAAVFKLKNGDDYHHVGLYVGDGMVIEAKGTAYGVVTSKVKEWDCWALLKGVEYKEQEKKEVIYQAKVCTDETGGGLLNLRKKPTGSATVIARLKNKDQVDVLEEDGAWALIDTKLGQGYAMTRFLRRMTDDGKVIVVDADGTQYAMRLPISIREGAS